MTANNQTCTNGDKKTLKDLQKELGINRETWRRYTLLTTLYEPIQTMVSEGKLTVSDASRHIARLSYKEQMLFYICYRDRDKVTHRDVRFFCNIILPEVRNDLEEKNNNKQD